MKIPLMISLVFAVVTLASAQPAPSSAPGCAHLAAPPQAPSSPIALQETFDQTTGYGGNDGLFDGNSAGKGGHIVYDLEGWTNYNAFAADRCLKMGTTTYDGVLFTPVFQLDGNYVLTFKAAPWGNELAYMVWECEEGTGLTLDNPTGSYMTGHRWNTYAIHLEGSGTFRLKLYANMRRFFIDDILIKKADAGETTGISEMLYTKTPAAIYSLDGQRLRQSFSELPHGIYIVNGRKMAK